MYISTYVINKTNREDRGKSEGHSKENSTFQRLFRLFLCPLRKFSTLERFQNLIRKWATCQSMPYKLDKLSTALYTSNTFQNSFISDVDMIGVTVCIRKEWLNFVITCLSQIMALRQFNKNSYPPEIWKLFSVLLGNLHDF